jgi:glycosyltransferase involved in cell wall biosynthesis
MKIALVVPGFSSSERDWCIPALLDYVRVLAEEAEVHVFTLRWPERRGCYRVYGASVHAMDGRRHMGARAAGLWARAVRAIAAEHRRGPFDVVHAFWLDEASWVAALAGRRLRVPVVVSVAGGELVGLRDIGYGLGLLPGRRLLGRWLMGRAALVTGGSDYLLRLIRQSVPDGARRRIRRAPLGVDLDRFRPAASAQAANVALNVGALYPVKDQAMLLKTAARVPGLIVRIAGAGPLLGALKSQAAELGLEGRVEFLSAVEHGALPGVYREAGVFVQTSRHEAQGMALLEAAACGRPVIGTPVGVLPEIGTMVSTEVDLAGALEALRDDPVRRLRLGREARERAAEGFGLARARRTFCELYAEAAGRG